MRIGFVMAGAAVAAILANPAAAKDVRIKMLNQGAAGMMVFEPALVKIAPGDTVTFVAVDKGHSVESIAGMIPSGAVPFKGKISESLQVKFTKRGLYGFKCVPHYSMGMVGAVIVGNSTPNAAQAKAVSQPFLAKQAFARLIK